MKTMIIVEESRPALLSEVTELLAQHEIALSDFSGRVVGRTAVISLQSESYKEGFRLLSEAGYQVYASETLLVRLEEKPGALAELSRRLSDAGVNVRGLHMVNKDNQAGIVALETADQNRAREVLHDILV